MRDIVLVGSIAELRGRSDLADTFDLTRFLTTNIGHGVADACAADIFVTSILQLLEPDRTFIEALNDPGVFVWVGEQRGGCLGIHEQGSELGGGDLKTDFGKFLRVMFAQIIGEVILEVGKTKLIFLFCAPLLIAAASTPVGNIAFGDGDAALLESPDDFGIGNV